MIAACLLMMGLAQAQQTLPLYDGAGSAFTVGSGHGSAGIFTPVRYGLTENVELSTSGLATLVAPRLDVKWTALRNDHLGLALVGGLGLPTFGLRLLQGTALTSDPAEKPAIAVVAKAAVVLSAQAEGFTFSLWGMGRMALPGTGPLTPPDMPWVDPMLQPITEGPALTAKLVIDWFPADAVGLETWGVTLEGRVHLLGEGIDVDARLFARYRLGKNVAFGAGTALSAAETPAGRPIFLVPLVDMLFRW